MKLLKDSKLNEIRGKALVGRATPKEIILVFGHLDALEKKMDGLDGEDFFGTEGWRRFFGVPE